jgi:CMP-N,N'-diacetyllegionaminic acid synthase
LPGKNIKELCGKPLIAWSIESALNSKYIDEVMVTTDNQNIAEISKQYGANVPFLRPEELASDTATTFDAVKHTIEFYKNELNKEFDYIVLLEPTSPLRELEDIDNMIEKMILNENDFDSIVSIGEAHEHPSIMKKIINEKYLSPYCIELEMKSRRQDNDIAYFPYGVAYIVKTKSLLDEKTFYTKRNTFYKIKRYQCYEIDDIYDFLAIENIMKYERSL